MIGYRLEPTGTIQIEESEAAIVREIYTSFAHGMSMGAIANLLTSRGIPRRCGSTVWERKNVEKIFRNEKYAGFAILQKTYTTDCLNHTRATNHGERPKYKKTNNVNLQKMPAKLRTFLGICTIFKQKRYR